jgi:hypothetical protein
VRFHGGCRCLAMCSLAVFAALLVVGGISGCFHGGQRRVLILSSKVRSSPESYGGFWCLPVVFCALQRRMGDCKDYGRRSWCCQRVLVVIRRVLIVAGRFPASCWRRGTLFGCWWLLFLIGNTDILVEDKDYLGLIFQSVLDQFPCCCLVQDGL